jgi:hypothetical protein
MDLYTSLTYDNLIIDLLLVHVVHGKFHIRKKPYPFPWDMEGQY